MPDTQAPVKPPRMTIHAPDPKLEDRAFRELVESVAATKSAGVVAGQLIVRAKQALHEDDSEIAHRLEDLSRELLAAARRHDQLVPDPLPSRVMYIGPVDVVDLINAEFGSEVTR